MHLLFPQVFISDKLFPVYLQHKQTTCFLSIEVLYKTLLKNYPLF